MKHRIASSEEKDLLPKGRETKLSRRIGALVGRVLCFVLATLLIVAGGLVGVIYVLEKGPSESARAIFVRSVRETSAIGFLADFFLTQEEIALIEAEDVEHLPADSTDVSMITVSHSRKDTSGEDLDGSETAQMDIEILSVEGSTFKGKLMIVADPTRVVVGVSKYLGASGQTLEQMIEGYGAVGGVNAGGFKDEGGTGNGGIPTGIVVHEGELLYGAGVVADTVVIDGDGILHVGRMSGQEAMELGAQYAVSFGPILVVNGEKCSGLASGLNPRTAIGQRADGAILLLVINGRQLESPGATYEDLADVMLEHGAVNAMNLDGGSSSMMIYEGEYMTKSSSVVGQRGLPTCIIVK